ncbi:S8 family peptidase [Heyndrickxia acidiproducens]|uniref:S8 family peptidase n=1 Tax=Heyndrickxia acidiproducens TaxID=1121084 RepID=UPI0003789DEB|nr:S8 family peptidase [Heyndrickxia acidiproducens]
MKKKLIPFKVLKVYEKVEETIPEGVKLIQAPDVWEKAGFGEGIVIAVIDTGIDKTHPDLKDRIIGGKDFTNTGDYQDDNGHGTHVCGTILASQNAQGVVGVAPAAKVLVLKALDQDGSGQSEWIEAALDYAIKWKGPQGEKVSVISMSLGGPADEKEHALIKEAVENNILVVCAAGNSGDGRADTDELDYPGAYPEVVEIGAVDLQKQLADFSNTNEEIDMVAPGVEILSTYPGSKYAKLSGTSMATPHVSGAAALVKIIEEEAFGRKLTEAELYAQLCIHTENLGLSKKEQGNGMIHLTRSAQNTETGEKEINITVESKSLGLKAQTVTVIFE